MRRVSAVDLPVMVRQFTHYCRHSFFSLQSVHGYSFTELEAVFEEAPPLLFANESVHDSSLLQLSEIDSWQGHARIQICGKPHASWLQKVREMLLPLGIGRLYTFVFPEEVCEIEALRRADFQLEVVFRQHLYMAGRFHDLHVYGLLYQET
jgi:hypothetical protein